MNVEKAKEFFSAYYEGELEKGLSEALERKLAADSRLREEYEAFKATMASLKSLSEPVPEPDFDLHEIITARLDRHIWESERKKKTPFLQWWRSLALGGLAVLALVAALLQINSRGDVETTRLVGVDAPGQLRLVEDDSGLTLRYLSSGTQRVDIKNFDGEVLRTQVLKDGRLASALTNLREESLLLEIDVQGNQAAYVAVPGKKPAHRLKGEGALIDFVLAVADHYRVPVALKGVDLKKPIAWNFELTDAFQSIERHLGDGIEKRDGVIWIIGN